MCTWTYTGEVQSKRIRERYLQAVLRQDIAYFDKLGAGEVTTRIQTDCHLVQQGISEKVARTWFDLQVFLMTSPYNLLSQFVRTIPARFSRT
jgi:ABC-type multidrug transport system fused ATPase/permease subunit